MASFRSERYFTVNITRSISHALDCQPGDLLEFTEARALVSKWVQIPNIWRLVPGLGPGYSAA